MTIETITVTLTYRPDGRHQHDAWFGMDAVRELRAAGVPVVGHLLPIGVEHGTLTCVSSGDKVSYCWDFDPANIESVL